MIFLIYFSDIIQLSSNACVFKELRDKIDRHLSNILSLELNICSTMTVDTYTGQVRIYFAMTKENEKKFKSSVTTIEKY